MWKEQTKYIVSWRFPNSLLKYRCYIQAAIMFQWFFLQSTQWAGLYYFRIYTMWCDTNLSVSNVKTNLILGFQDTETWNNSTWFFLDHPWKFYFFFNWNLEFPHALTSIPLEIWVLHWVSKISVGNMKLFSFTQEHQ